MNYILAETRTHLYMLTKQGKCKNPSYFPTLQRYHTRGIEAFISCSWKMITPDYYWSLLAKHLFYFFNLFFNQYLGRKKNIKKSRDILETSQGYHKFMNIKIIFSFGLPATSVEEVAAT